MNQNYYRGMQIGINYVYAFYIFLFRFNKKKFKAVKLGQVRSCIILDATKGYKKKMANALKSINLCDGRAVARVFMRIGTDLWKYSYFCYVISKETTEWGYYLRVLVLL